MQMNTRATIKRLATPGESFRLNTRLEADFRALTFEHAVSLWTTTNPSFFDGTSVEGAVRDELERVSVQG